jgi:hypothetical protein
MSATLIYAVGAIALSGLMLVTLARRDPKRLRADAGGRIAPLSPMQRRALGVAVLVPAVILMVMGQWPAFLIWLGGTTMLGWALAHGFAPRTTRRPR